MKLLSILLLTASLFGYGTEIVPWISFNSQSVTEGTGNIPNVGKFKVALSVTTSKDVSFNYTTKNGTAIANEDYIPVSGIAVIPAGQRVVEIPVQIIGDSKIETMEFFGLELSNFKNANPANTSSIMLIIDDDSVIVPKLDIDFPRIKEGNFGTSELKFKITLNTPVNDKEVKVTASVARVYGLSAGKDYIPPSPKEFIFARGEVEKTYPITIIGDTVLESVGAIWVQLSNANVNLIHATSVGLVINDD